MNAAIKDTAAKTALQPVETEITAPQKVVSIKQDAIILEKTQPKPQHDDTSAIIDDLLRPLNSFKKNKAAVKTNVQKEKTPEALLNKKKVFNPEKIENQRPVILKTKQEEVIPEPEYIEIAPIKEATEVSTDRKNILDPGKTENQQAIILKAKQEEKISEPEYIEIVPLEKTPVIIEDRIDRSSSFIDPDPLNKLKNKKQTKLAPAPISPKATIEPEQQIQLEEIQSASIEEASAGPMIPIIIDNEPLTPAVDEILQNTAPLIEETVADSSSIQSSIAQIKESEENTKAAPLNSAIFEDVAPITDKELKEETAALDKMEPASSNYRSEPSNKIRVWEAKKGNNLQKVIEKWSAKERVALSWNSDERYRLDFDVFISGTYKNALGVLLSKGIKKAPEYTLSEAPYNLLVQSDED